VCVSLCVYMGGVCLSQTRAHTEMRSDGVPGRSMPTTRRFCFKQKHPTPCAPIAPVHVHVCCLDRLACNRRPQQSLCNKPATSLQQACPAVEATSRIGAAWAARAFGVAPLRRVGLAVSRATLVWRGTCLGSSLPRPSLGFRV
jgi:hypothetical protein